VSERPSPHDIDSSVTWRAALLGRCARCGEGRLFRGPASLALAPGCDRCGLDYAFADSGDGPAVFAILILGVVLLGAALVAEFRYGLPVWGHVVLWSLVTPILALGLLRVLKGGLIALQFRHGAEEQRFDNRG
jgi:uncharacterized protein (DUF983 family)